MTWKERAACVGKVTTAWPRRDNRPESAMRAALSLPRDGGNQ